jgi:hypothetical protein
MFCGPVCCHFRFATCQIPTIRWYEAIIFMLCNIITAQTPLVIENSGINLILLLKRSEKKKKRFPLCQFLLTIHNIKWILQSIYLDISALLIGRASSMIAQMQIISMAKDLKFLCVLKG